MTDDRRIDELLSLYERRTSEGGPFSDEELQELCWQHSVDWAEVRRQIALLQAADKLLDLPGVEQSDRYSAVEGAPGKGGQTPAPPDSEQSQQRTVNEHWPVDTGESGAKRPADLPAHVGPYLLGRELKQGGMGRIVPRLG